MTRARRLIVVVAICLMAALAAPLPLRAVPPPHAPRAAVVGSTGWIQQILDAIGGRRVSVAVGVDGVTWFDHGGDVPRQPASNEKLLLSMALLLSARSAFAQKTTGDISGTVTDTTGGILPGVTVTAVCTAAYAMNGPDSGRKSKRDPAP